MCSTLVPSRGLCRIFAYRTRHTQSVARLFLRVASVGSLLIERGRQLSCRVVQVDKLSQPDRQSCRVENASH